MTDLIARLTELRQQRIDDRRAFGSVAIEWTELPIILRALKVQQAAEASIEALQAEVTTLRTALDKYGKHIGRCPGGRVVPNADRSGVHVADCMCGFWEALHGSQ